MQPYEDWSTVTYQRLNSSLRCMAEYCKLLVQNTSWRWTIYLLTYLLIDSMQHSPSEANQFAASQEIPQILWNPKGSFPRLLVPATCLYPDPAWSSPCPNTSHFMKIHPNIILPSTPGSTKWSFPLRFPHQNSVQASPLPPLSTTCPAHLILLDLMARTIFVEQYKSLSPSLRSFLHSPVTSSLWAQIASSAPCSETPSGYIPPSMWATKFHTHTKPFTVLRNPICFLSFMFLAINTYYFSKQYNPVSVLNGDTMCSLWGMNWTYGVNKFG